MRTDRDDPAAVAAAVRALAADVHRVLAGAASGELDRADEALAGLQQWASLLLDLVGEGRPEGLRRSLQDLQRRIFLAQWLGKSPEDRLEAGGRQPTRLVV